MLKGIQPSSKAYSPTPAQVAATRRGNRRDLAVLATVIVLALVAGTAWLSTSVSEAPQTPRPGLAAAPSPAPPRTSAQATPSAEDTTAAPKSTESAERVRRGAAARDAVAIFVKRGFIKRMDLERGRFYVDGPLWESFEFNDKQNMVKMISWYREAEYKGLPQVSLLESRSGKELANYGAFTGVTIR